MPVIVQNTMGEMQKKMGPMMQQKRQELVPQIATEKNQRH